MSKTTSNMARMIKLLKIIAHLVFIISINYIITRKSFNPDLHKRLVRFLPDLKHVLLWDGIHGIHANGQKQLIDKKCHYYNCYLTTNKSLFQDIRYFDAIVFNLQQVSSGEFRFPKVRGQYQKYIFAANDSADNYPVCNPKFDGFFNWTWTYKRNSTIPYRFISVYNIEDVELGSHFKWQQLNQAENNIKKDLTQKSLTAVTFLDKCTSKSGREHFIKELQEALKRYNMTLDVYGKCGTMECKKKTIKPCLFKLKKYYFFYLALEDSFAKDYLTKGVLYAYKNNAVPIVFGKADYNKFLPPNSYLDALALGSQKLAQVMYQIISDQSKYIKFFNWKSHYKFMESEVLNICELCEALNNVDWMTEKAIYEDFRGWWNEEPCEKSKVKAKRH